MAACCSKHSLYFFHVFNMSCISKIVPGADEEIASFPQIWANSVHLVKNKALFSQSISSAPVLHTYKNAYSATVIQSI